MKNTREGRDKYSTKTSEDSCIFSLDWTHPQLWEANLFWQLGLWSLKFWGSLCNSYWPELMYTPIKAAASSARARCTIGCFHHPDLYCVTLWKEKCLQLSCSSSSCAWLPPPMRITIILVVRTCRCSIERLKAIPFLIPWLLRWFKILLLNSKWLCVDVLSMGMCWPDSHCCFLPDSPNMTGYLSVVRTFKIPTLIQSSITFWMSDVKTLFLSFQKHLSDWNQINHKGEVKAGGGFTYDSIGNKLRFRSNESSPVNTSLTLDLLVFFDEVLHTLNSTNGTVHLLLFWTVSSIFMTLMLSSLVGGILWNWQQKPQLCEENTALHYESSWCTWWCHPGGHDAYRECIS